MDVCSVGASGEWMGGVGLYGRPSSLSASLEYHPGRCVSGEAGDHKGPPQGAINRAP